jgi:hypothetical protein
LKNVTHSPAPQLAQLAVGGFEDVAPFQQDFSARIKSRRGPEQTPDGQCGHAFTGPAFADQAERFAGADGERHAIDGANNLTVRAKFELQISDFQQRQEMYDRGASADEVYFQWGATARAFDLTGQPLLILIPILIFFVKKRD